MYLYSKALIYENNYLETPIKWRKRENDFVKSTFVRKEGNNHKYSPPFLNVWKYVIFFEREYFTFKRNIILCASSIP